MCSVWYSICSVWYSMCSVWYSMCSVCGTVCVFLVANGIQSLNTNTLYCMCMYELCHPYNVCFFHVILTVWLIK